MNGQQSKKQVLITACFGAVLYLYGVGDLAAAGRGSTAIPPSLQQADRVQRQLSDHKTLTATQINRVNMALTSDQQQELNQIGKLLAKDPNSRLAQKRWQSLIHSMATAKPAVDVNALVQWVMQESYLQASSSLRSHADKVKFFNEQKDRIRDEINRARAHTTGHSRRGGNSLSSAFAPDDRLYKNRLIPARRPIVEKSILTTYISGLEAKLVSTSNDGQLANVELQNALQKQQQLLQTLSHISKRLHDTAMAIIRKIGG